MFKLLNSVFPSRLTLATAVRRLRRGHRPGPLSEAVSKTVESLEGRRLFAAFVVDTLADENDGIGAGAGVSLRDAIEAANVNNEPDSITFHPSLTSGGPATITLSLGALPIIDTTGATTITGPNATSLTVSGNNASRVFTVAANATATITGLTITGGNGDGAEGGAIHNDGTLTVESSVLTSNTATTTGGAIYSGGTLNVSDVTFTGNTAGTHGGAIWNQAGTATVDGSTFTGNSAADDGGAIGNFDSLVVNDSTFTNNNADRGGAIVNNDTFTVTSSVFTTNHATAGDGGAIANLADGSVSSSSFSGNTATANGGAVLNSDALIVDRSTFNGNSADLGGAFYNTFVLIISSSTIASNTATTNGGGIFSTASTQLSHSTISANSSPATGGIKDTAPVLHNTIIAGNTGTNPDVTAPVIPTSAYNLIGNGTGISSGISNGTNGNKIGTALAPINALLGPLADNGGTTLTMKPLPGSPAIDAGNPGFAGPPNTDQRGYARIAHNRVDIGAVETPFIHFVIARDTGEAVRTGNSVSFTITALDEFNQPVAGYEPTVSFSSNDTAANVPGNLTLTGGTGTFSGTFNTQGSFTFTATDTVTPAFVGSSPSLFANASPTDLGLSNNVVAENQGSGTTVGTLSTTDNGDPGSHTYTLVAGAGSTDNALFTIDGTTLKTGAVFNFENKSSYSIRVRSTDAGGLFSEEVITVDVSNVNEGPTDLALTGTVEENQPAGTTVGTLSTTDADAGDTFSYTLVPGAGSDDNALFTISGGSLKTAAAFDFEAKSSYTVRVRSTDAGGLSTEKAITVTVTDGSDAPTDLALSNAVVQENLPVGTVVGNLTGTDPDGPSDTITFSIVPGEGDADNASFSVVGNQLRTAVVFTDFERSEYSVRVRATDAAGLTTEKAFLVTVPNPKLQFAQPPKNVVAGVAMKKAVTVRRLNADGTQNKTDASKLKLTIVSGPKGGKIIGGKPLTTKAGLTTFAPLSFNVAGTYVLRVSGGKFGSTTATFNVSPAAAVGLAFTAPKKATAEAPFSVQVRVVDRFGNTVTKDKRQITLSLASGPAGSSLDGTLKRKAVAGVATFDNLSLDSTGTYTLKATGGAFSATSKAIKVNA